MNVFYNTNINNKKLTYLFSTKEKENLYLYFKMKNKNGHYFKDKEEERKFIYKVLNFIKKYDVIIIPQTSGKLLPKIAKMLSKKVIIIKKNSIEKIKKELFTQKMMKAEKESLLKSIEEMGNEFKIGQIKGNQRKRFLDILFEKQDLSCYNNKKTLVLDDSVFSGDTLKALVKVVDIDYDLKVVFSKY